MAWDKIDFSEFSSVKIDKLVSIVAEVTSEAIVI
jgi:hypothetical protein